MTSSRPPSELDAEREVDLARWRRAVVRLWWLPVAGLILGIVIGALFSLHGSKTYKASALVSLGQPVSPGGTIIQSFATNPAAISEITSSASAQAQAEQAAGMASGALRGRVSVAAVGTTPGTAAARTATLISLTVEGPNPTKDAAAANALANIIVTRTTAAYVQKKIKTYESVLGTVDTQLSSIVARIAQLNKVINGSSLAPLDKLVLVSQLDNEVQRQGNLLNQQATTNQQLAFAQEVESAKVITSANSVASVARTRTTSVVIGALIGLILGAVAAIVSDGRRRPAAV